MPLRLWSGCWVKVKDQVGTVTGSVEGPMFTMRVHDAPLGELVTFSAQDHPAYASYDEITAAKQAGQRVRRVSEDSGEQAGFEL